MTSMEEKILDTQIKLIDRVKKKESSYSWWNHYIQEGYSEDDPLLKNLLKVSEEYEDEIKHLKQELIKLIKMYDGEYIHKDSELLLNILNI